MLIGMVQIGIMYLFYYNAFLYLSVPEILLFTIFTPFYVTLIYDILHRRFSFLYLISAAIAVFGAYVIRYDNINEGFWFGFLLIQGANICFALGQSGYKYVLENYKEINQKDVFGYFHFGALIIGTIALMLFGDFNKMSPDLTQWGVLIWLGFVASGVGYFMWNKGSTMVDAGVLAIMNNALIPAGLIVNIVFWGKDENFTKLIVGSIIILFSLWVHSHIIKIVDKKQKTAI
jgi:carboxylate/amino acid/amine transporter